MSQGAPDQPGVNDAPPEGKIRLAITLYPDVPRPGCCLPTGLRVLGMRGRMVRIPVGSVCLVTAILCSRHAAAQSAPTSAFEDQPSSQAEPVKEAPAGRLGGTVITRRDGTILRGDIIERVPGRYLVLRLATGEVRHVPWEDLAEERAVDPDGPTVEAPGAWAERAPPAPQVARDQEADRTVSATLQADHPDATLMRRGAAGWEPVCRAPCQAMLDPEDHYRVDGRGLRPSRPFQLPRGRDPVQLRTSVGTSSQHGWGIVLLIGGGAIGFVGSQVLLTGLLLTAFDEPDGLERTESASSVTAVGAVMTVGGLATGIAGLLMLTGNRTTVTLVGRQGSPPEPRVAITPGLELTARGFVF